VASDFRDRYERGTGRLQEAAEQRRSQIADPRRPSRWGPDSPFTAKRQEWEDKAKQQFSGGTDKAFERRAPDATRQPLKQEPVTERMVRSKAQYRDEMLKRGLRGIGSPDVSRWKDGPNTKDPDPVTPVKKAAPAPTGGGGGQPTPAPQPWQPQPEPQPQPQPEPQPQPQPPEPSEQDENSDEARRIQEEVNAGILGEAGSENGNPGNDVERRIRANQFRDQGGWYRYWADRSGY